METVTNWAVIAGSVTLVGIVISSWLASYRARQAAPIGSRDWFFSLPAWAQIVGGLASIPLFILLGYLLWIPLPLALPSDAEIILRITGFVLFLAGWILVLWARASLGAMYGVSTSFAARLRAQHRLVQRGAYAHVRHPMYLGYWLMLAGAATIYRTWMPLLFLVMCVASFHRRARREEIALSAAFGAEWQEYAARVPMFLPRLP